MEKHLEIKSIQHPTNGIKVMVRIDYINGLISLVEKDASGNTEVKVSTKKWCFANREIEYMQGWIEIFEAMTHAIKEAAKDLKEFQDLKEKENTDLIIKLSKEKL
jgi:hypothetical protein